MGKLTDFLNGVRIGDPITHANMTVYPLHVQNGHSRGYRTLDDALKANEFKVTEQNEGGNVPVLVVHNEGEIPVLMVIGEELVGAKQNRVLNTSILVPAKSNLQIPVSCVERGRWSYRSREFSTHETTAHFYLRKAQTENVTTSLRMAHDTTSPRAYDADQSKVWAEVDRKISSHESTSNTAALHDMYTQTADTLDEYLGAFTAPEHAQGFLVAINGEIVGGDLFDHEETLIALWRKLIRGYAVDAVERARWADRHKPDVSSVPDEPDTDMFLRAAVDAVEEYYQSVGLGEDVRLSSEQISGSGLVWDNQPVHTSLFSAKA